MMIRAMSIILAIETHLEQLSSSDKICQPFYIINV